MTGFSYKNLTKRDVLRKKLMEEIFWREVPVDAAIYKKISNIYRLELTSVVSLAVEVSFADDRKEGSYANRRQKRSR